MAKSGGRSTRMVAADAAGVAVAVECLRRGELVAFPTETVYGLGADGLNPEAVQAIFTAKGRPADNPLILHLADPAAAAALTPEGRLPKAGQRLADRFWPGPLTLVVPARDDIPGNVRAGLPTVALRVPAHPVALAILRGLDRPVAAPSANRSGRPSPTTAEDVWHDLRGRVACIVDGGPTPVGVESTVVDVSGPVPTLLRPGGIPREAIEAEVGRLADPGPGPARAPGMKYTHYAPRIPVVWLRSRDPDNVAALLETLPLTPGEMALLAPTPVWQRLGLVFKAAFDLGPDAEHAASRLFRCLRAADHGVRRIVVVWEGEQGLGLAVSNRLQKAARWILPEGRTVPHNEAIGRPEDAVDVLFVCTGNTCRSPMAAALLRQVAPHWRVESAGLAAYTGVRASPAAVRAVARLGADLSGHRAQSLREWRKHPALVLTMTAAQAEEVLRLRPDWRGRVERLTDFVGATGDIADPIGGDQAVYDALAERLWELVRQVPAARYGRSGEPA